LLPNQYIQAFNVSTAKIEFTSALLKRLCYSG